MAQDLKGEKKRQKDYWWIWNQVLSKNPEVCQLTWLLNCRFWVDFAPHWSVQCWKALWPGAIKWKHSSSASRNLHSHWSDMGGIRICADNFKAELKWGVFLCFASWQICWVARPATRDNNLIKPFCIDSIVWWVLHVDLVLSQHNFQRRDYIPCVTFDGLQWKQRNLGNKKTTFLCSAKNAAKTFSETTALPL